MTLYQRVATRAAKASFRVAVGTLFIAPFYALAWMLGRTARLVWSALVWSWESIGIGFKDGWGK